jgi:hypothetical protein
MFWAVLFKRFQHASVTAPTGIISPASPLWTTLIFAIEAAHEKRTKTTGQLSLSR